MKRDAVRIFFFGWSNGNVTLLNFFKSSYRCATYEVCRIFEVKIESSKIKSNVMKLPCSVRNALLICTAVLLSISFTSWKEGVPDTVKPAQDTVPPKGEKKIVDLDKAMQDLDEAQEDLRESIRDIDWDKMNTELKETMKDLQVDLQKMNVELKKSLQEIDVEKMRRDVEESVASINWDQIKRDLESVKNVDLEKVKVELEQVKVELQNLKPELERSLKGARESIEQGKAELREYKTFVDGLERDGLIVKGKPYKIEHKDKQLLINSKVQSQDVYNKYRTFLEKHKTFTLEENKDDVKLDNE